MVVHCFLPESVGGTEFYTYNLSKELIQRGFDVVILTAVDDAGQERYGVRRTTFEGLKIIKIMNSPRFARTFLDYFVDPKIDMIFREVVSEERPDIIHFQHIAYLSGNLPEIASGMGIPGVFTLHDYWYMCFRSQLIRPGSGLCPGPSEGLHCASCDDVLLPDTLPRLKFRVIDKIANLSLVRRYQLKEKIPVKLRKGLKPFFYKLPSAGNRQEQTYTNPYIVTVLQNKFRLDFFRRQLSFPKVVLSPSHHLKMRFENEGFREITCLPLGFYEGEKVDRLHFDGKLKIAYLGNIVPFKGALIILQELAGLPVPEKEKIEINFHGRKNDQTYALEMEQYADAFPAGTVRFHGGYRSDRELRSILSQNHLIIFPSLWEENYPLVVRESLLHGVPVIGAKLGGVPEAIEHGINGYLFDPYTEGDLRKKISLLLNNPHILARITEGARDTKIESMENHISNIIDIYKRIIS